MPIQNKKEVAEAPIVDTFSYEFDIGYLDLNDKYNFNYADYNDYLLNRGLSQEQVKGLKIITARPCRDMIATHFVLGEYARDLKTILIRPSPMLGMKNLNKILSHETEHFIRDSQGVDTKVNSPYQKRCTAATNVGGLGAAAVVTVQITTDIENSSYYDALGISGMLAASMALGGMAAYRFDKEERAARSAEKANFTFLEKKK